MVDLWSKFRLNVCNNLPQAILGAGVGCYRDRYVLGCTSKNRKRAWNTDFDGASVYRTISLVLAEKCRYAEMRFYYAN